MAKYLLVDGYNMVFRAFYAMPDSLTRADGLPTGAIHGWLNTLKYLQDNEKPDQGVVFFDLGGASRQAALFADYKANRAAMPDALRAQMPYVKRLARLMGFGAIEKEGVEADDLIATWAKRLSAEGHSVRIVSADKDLGQCLVLPNVSQLLPPPTANAAAGWRQLDSAGVEEKFGVPPSKVADLLALVGDSSDNIPGLDGVGPKTAAKWLIQFGNVEGVIANCGDLKPVRFQNVVYQNRELLRRNLAMTTLDYEVSVDGLDCPPRDTEALCALLEELEMRRALKAIREG
ncbi:MAG: 5'-3' exonuclease [Opitutales bacterium]|nr:5'-3' exonuclease [Opitutales bacterium]